jgi:hypothetical protein
VNAQQKTALLRLIAHHTQAQIEKSWSGSQPPEDHAAYEADAREAEDELMQFVDRLGEHLAVEAMAVMRLQNEVRFLNRALQRKNRRLKGQYEALKGKRKMFDIQVLYSDAFHSDVPLKIKRIEGRSDGTRILVTAIEGASR